MKKKVIFMGSPAYAVPTLQALIDSHHEILCVYTQSPKPSGRGKKINKTPIHELAEKTGLLVKTPKNFKNQEDIEVFEQFKADIVVVVAYGLIIPQILLDMPQYGFMNLHPSSLPKYRGAAPIQRALLAGEKTLDICIMKMDQGVDTGDVYMRKTMNIAETDNFQKMHDVTSILGAEMIIQTLDNIDHAILTIQESSTTCYAEKIQKEEAEILFDKDDYRVINNKLRALNPIPGVYFYLKDKKVKIKEAVAIKEDHQHTASAIIITGKQIKIACIGGFIIPQILQMEGKNPMQNHEFLNGFRSLIA